jgi:hypothetical protein
MGGAGATQIRLDELTAKMRLTGITGDSLNSNPVADDRENKPGRVHNRPGFSKNFGPANICG